MENHYETLGLNTVASMEEIRRAYRILARRYHPDVNPGKPDAEEKFKKIAAAYAVLGDPVEKNKYDAELEGTINLDKHFAHRAYQRAQRQSAKQRYEQSQQQDAQQRRGPNKPPPPLSPKDNGDSLFASLGNSIFDHIGGIFGKTSKKKDKRKAGNDQNPGSKVSQRVSVIEVSLNIRDAIYGVKKTVEIAEPEGVRKISVSIPQGVRNGSVVHLRSKSAFIEELIIIVRVAAHPILSIQTRGLVAEIPISVREAIAGASVAIPTLEDPISVRIPPGSNSGSEIRIAEKGLIHRDNSRGDLFVRFLIHVPQSPEAVGLKDKAREIDAYYENSVRAQLPKSLLE